MTVHYEIVCKVEFKWQQYLIIKESVEKYPTELFTIEYLKTKYPESIICVVQ